MPVTKGVAGGLGPSGKVFLIVLTNVVQLSPHQKTLCPLVSQSGYGPGCDAYRFGKMRFYFWCDITA